MPPSAIVESLSTSPLFGTLRPAALADIAGHARVMRFQAGEMVVWQGEPSATMYVIAHGIAAVQRLAPIGRETVTLAHLMPGQTFGEIGILEHQPRSASVVALTRLDVLAFERDDVLQILQQYPSVAIELARSLGRALVDTERRHAHGSRDGRLMLVFDLGAGNAAAGLAHLLASRFAGVLGEPTIYAEHPAPERLADALDLAADGCTRAHPAGYDTYIPHDDRSLPAAVRATLLLDDIAGQYRNTIVVLPGALDASSMVFLEQATHFIAVAPSTAVGPERVERLRAGLARYTASGRAALSVVAAHDTGATDGTFAGADYELPALDPWPTVLSPNAAPIPEPADRVVSTLIDRIDRSHQLALYLPTTVAVDQAFDTKPYVDCTLAFLGERFGGATSRQAQGVWRSEMAGLVGETVHIVQTYATEGDLNRYLDMVLDFVRMLKRELSQEAMAIELDQKLMLI